MIRLFGKRRDGVPIEMMNTRNEIVIHDDMLTIDGIYVADQTVTLATAITNATAGDTLLLNEDGDIYSISDKQNELIVHHVEGTTNVDEKRIIHFPDASGIVYLNDSQPKLDDLDVKLEQAFKDWNKHQSKDDK